MKIEKITSRSRRDFSAIYKCDHCDDAHEDNGYDDAYFHNEVVPKMICPKCGKTAGDDYLPLATKYPDGQTV